MKGLISGTVYDVSLVAVYDTGNQTSASTISGTTLANPPTIDSITNPTVNSLTVNYSAPEIGSLPINYTVVATPDSYDNNQSIITVSSIANNLTVFTIGNLVSATTYDISMIAVYDIGNFVSTGSFSGTTTSNPPTSIIVTGTTASSIDLSYNPPIGSSPIGYFAIAKPTTTSVGQTSVTTLQTTSNQITIRGLFAGTTYDISMVAVYSVGNQISTISVSGSTLFSPPTITVLNKNITDASTNAITVYFSPPSGTLPTTYNATAVPDFTNNRQSIVDVTGLSNSITSFVIGNLISGTSYDISMSAVYATGYSGSNVLTGNTLFNAATF
jgi:predicted heme/steroid binding protein